MTMKTRLPWWKGTQIWPDRSFSEATMTSREKVSKARYDIVGLRGSTKANALSQRVALLEVWKTFEEKNGTEDEIKKVQGMFPIVSRKRRVDEETGQAVEGMS